MATTRSRLLLLRFHAILLAGGCAAHDHRVVGDDGRPGARAAVAGRSSTTSRLPLPPTSGVPRPSGTPGNLTVLDWAGFRAAVSFTLDDSQPSHIAHYAELQSAGVPMTFYINAGDASAPDFDAAWARAVKDGHEIGNHTRHHCRADLTGCLFGAAPTDAAAEIDSNAAYVTQHTAQPAVWTMASPFGDRGWDRPAQGSVFINRGVHAGTIAPGDASDPFDLPAYVAGTGESADRLNDQTDRARAGGRWLIFVLHSIAPTSASWYNPVDIAAVTASMVHARKGEDVWVDTVVAVGAYWRAQKMLTGGKPVVTGDASTWSWTLPPHFPRGHYLRVRVDGGTLRQGGGAPLAWNDHGYYEVELDAGSLTLSP